MLIKRLDISYCADITRLEAKAYLEECPENISDCEEYHQWLRIFRDDDVVIGAFDGELLIGVASLIVTDYKKKSHFNDIFVDPDYSGREVSKKLLDSILAVADTFTDLKKCFLKVQMYMDEDDNWLSEYYSRYGFSFEPKQDLEQIKDEEDFAKMQRQPFSNILEPDSQNDPLLHPPFYLGQELQKEFSLSSKIWKLLPKSFRKTLPFLKERPRSSLD